MRRMLKTVVVLLIIVVVGISLFVPSNDSRYINSGEVILYSDSTKDVGYRLTLEDGRGDFQQSSLDRLLGESPSRVTYTDLIVVLPDGEKVKLGECELKVGKRTPCKMPTGTGYFEPHGIELQTD